MDKGDSLTTKKWRLGRAEPLLSINRALSVKSGVRVTVLDGQDEVLSSQTVGITKLNPIPLQ